jgi:predicted nuclease of predicted toxin-antitoxin system
MKLLADENLDRLIVERLRRDGYEVLYVAEVEPRITDNEVLQRANDLEALLLTADKDFGELVFQQSLKASFGVVLIRLSGLSVERKAQIVSEAFHKFEKDFLRSFSVITSGRVRIQEKR